YLLLGGRSFRPVGAFVVPIMADRVHSAPTADPTRGHHMPGTTDDLWEVMSTARTIRRFTDEPVGDDVLARCLEAATWAPNGANMQAWRFVVLRSPEQRAVVAQCAAKALEIIEPVYKMSRPDPDADDLRSRNNR